MNKIILIGRLTRDPEYNTYPTENGEFRVAKFSLAVSRNTERDDCYDYDGIYDVLYIMKEIVNWGFEEMQDIEWLQRGDLRLLYIDGFMNALNQEIFETEEANLEVEDDKKEE